MRRVAISSIVIFVSSIPCLGQVAGNALQFDGVNDSVNVPGGASLNLTSNLTIEAWVRPGGINGSKRVVSKHTPLMCNGFGFGQIDGKVRFTTYCIQDFDTTGQYLTSGVWRHIAVVFDSDYDTHFYVDGSFVETIAGNAAATGTNAALSIGQLDNSGGDFWNGLIDEIRVWNIARSPCDIEAYYDRQVDPNTQGLVGYWRFDESLGNQSVIDSSPSANNGTLGNTSGAASDDPARVASTAPIQLPASGPDCNANGVSDACDIASGTSQDCNANLVPDDCEVLSPAAASAIQFDGVDDHVIVPGFGNIAPTTEITIEFWQYATPGGEHPTCGLHRDPSVYRISAFAPYTDGRVWWEFGNTQTNGILSYTPAVSIFGAWHHFAMVASQSGNYMRIYRNGVLEASKSGMTPFVSSPHDFSIGSLREDQYFASFAGMIDEFRIWNLPRAQSEIQTWMNRRLQGSESGLVAYYRFDEGSGLTAVNSAAGSAVANGTLVNSPSWVTSGAPIFAPDPANDCNANSIPDSCDIASGAADCNSNSVLDSCEIAGGATDCNGDSILDACQTGLAPAINSSPQSLSVCAGVQASFSVNVTGPGTYAYQWRKNGAPIDGATNNPLVIPTTTIGDAGSYDVIVTTSCGQAISNAATLTINSDVPATYYALGTLCPPTAIPNASIIGFADDGPIAGSCFGQRSFRLFAGQEVVASGKLTRVRPGCIVQSFGPTLCTPESVLVDVHGRWQGVCSLPNLLIVGACNTIYFINPANGAICEQFPDPTFDHVGQMAIDSMGRLFVGSVDGDSLNVIDMGAVEAFYSAPGMSPRAVTIDGADNVYVTTAVDGVMSKVGPDGMVIDPVFATGLTGAISQAIAPQGIFHGNMFVACGDRVMEVDMTTGASSVYLSCRAPKGIAFDPEGYMHISIPSENKVLKIGASLPGDMNGSGAVTIDDTAGFAAALLQLPDAPLPIATADMNGDGCADGRDVQLFVNAAMGM
ncbi:MAG: hypothetical protein HZA51_12210 [Planctomycetes bacterium]|nr:hypothetical protein [Planctomycetota bacterium]